MNPCYSGFQVQGTATAPAGMTPPDPRNSIFNIITEKRKKCKSFSAFFIEFTEYLYDETAVYVQNLARDEISAFPGEKIRCPRDVLCGSEPRKRGLFP